MSRGLRKIEPLMYLTTYVVGIVGIGGIGGIVAIVQQGGIATLLNHLVSSKSPTT